MTFMNEKEISISQHMGEGIALFVKHFILGMMIIGPILLVCNASVVIKDYKILYNGGCLLCENPYTPHCHNWFIDCTKDELR